MGALARREAARKKSVRAGVAALVAVILATVFAVTAQNGLPDYVPGVERTTVRAAFVDTGALRAGDDVRIANVRAGFVDSIDLVDGTPVVTMKLDNGDTVYADATAQIAARSSLGQ
ncbi:MAG TPA: MlaD family protein, partial [Nocardioidaceae bacterium]|nr:MlaD family protein [Nocardioidaceae bacterium]